jgi:CBS domain-containing protein
VNDQPTPDSTALGAARVDGVMSAPLVTCAADVPLREVAELMTRHRIHAVVVLPDAALPAGEGQPWGVISEIDLVGAAPFDDPDVSAGRIAGTPVVQVDREEKLARAAMMMAEYAVTHLIVVGADGEPVGILSALDVARALSPAPAEPGERAGEEALTAPGLHAKPGDRLVIHGHQLGQPERDAEILEARGPGGGPPFLVRWEDGGRESLLYPGSDATVEPLGERR